MEGLPDGTPGLEKGFFERIPFLPSGMLPTSPPSKAKIVSIKESELPKKKSKAQSSILAVRQKLKELKSGEAFKVPKAISAKDDMEESHKIPAALNTERDIQIVQGNKKTINRLMEGSIPDAVKTEKAIRNSHGKPVMGMSIPVAHKTEMEIQSSHGLPGLESIIPVAMKTEMEIQRNQEEHPIQNHPVLSSMMIPQAQDTEREIADIHEQILEEERNDLETLMDGVPDGDPGLSRDFLEDANEVDASFLKALEKGSSKGMEDPGREVEDAVHRLYENQEFVGEEEEEIATTQPTRLHLFNSTDLVLMDFMVKQLNTQPGMRMKDKNEDDSEKMSVPDPVEQLTLTHKQLENLQKEQDKSSKKEPKEKDTKQDTSPKKGEKVKIMMSRENILMLSHDQLTNLKKQQELSEVKEVDDSKVTTASSEDPDMFETSPSQISIPKVTTKETTNVFSPTLIPSMADKKSRKRKFKNRIPSSEKSKPDEKSLKPKASKEQKQNLRRLFRNRQRNPVETKMEPKNKETSKDTVQQKTTEVPKITIEEKSNPRKIIFRKSFNGKTSRRLANGRLMLRKKKEKDGRKDPLVESLLSQIKRQKLKHRSFRRNRTGGVKRPLPAILNRPKVSPHAIHHAGPSVINYGKNNRHYRRFLSLRTLRL